jgi:hypothetical protein
LRGQAASRLASDLCRSGSAITVAEFGALAGLTCHASGMAEGPAARYALLQASGGTVATAAAPCLERMAHLPGLHRRPGGPCRRARHPETLKRTRQIIGMLVLAAPAAALPIAFRHEFDRLAHGKGICPGVTMRVVFGLAICYSRGRLSATALIS